MDTAEAGRAIPAFYTARSGLEIRRSTEAYVSWWARPGRHTEVRAARGVPANAFLLFQAPSSLVGLASGCHRTQRYESNVEVTRTHPIRTDGTGKPLTLDLEISYGECPGTQIEVIRGGAAFAECVSKYKVGDKVRVGIEHVWSSEGFYTWTVDRVGDCARVKDANDEASYAMVRECDDWLVNGQRVGFQCRYIPENKLLAACPWFRRR